MSNIQSDWSLFTILSINLKLPCIYFFFLLNVTIYRNNYLFKLYCNKLYIFTKILEIWEKLNLNYLKYFKCTIRMSHFSGISSVFTPQIQHTYWLFAKIVCKNVQRKLLYCKFLSPYQTKIYILSNFPFVYYKKKNKLKR